MDEDIKSQLSQEDIKLHEENHHFSGEKSFDYSQITDNIFLGTNMCCIVGYADELVKKDVVADISLEKERIDNPIGVDYFLWLPTLDTYPPTQSQLGLGVEAITYLTDNNIKLYVHCKNGHGRAPTLVVAYFVSKGSGVEEAVKTIKEKRYSIHPTQRQIDALEEFSKSIKNKISG